MIAIIQRVDQATVKIENKLFSKINHGILVFLGIGINDTKKDINYLCNKITNLRIFPDNNNKMNLNIQAIKGSILIISQFTLYAECNKGNRPSFTKAEKPSKAKNIYDLFVKQLKTCNITVQTGKFGATMNISLINNGPATFILDSKNEK